MMEENMDRSMYMHMKKKMFMGVVIGAFFAWLITWTVMMRKQTALIVQQPANITTTSSQGLNAKQFDLYQGMSKLWQEHVWWTREYLKSAINGGKDTDLVAARLLKNQEDIGNAIRPVYGDAAAIQLTTLLKTHIKGAVDVVTAAKSGNQKMLASANMAWYSNADDIASFLANANPNWKLTDVKSMMRMHLDLTKQEAVDLIGKNYEATIMDFQKIEDEILVMANALSGGIIKQFPEKF